MVRRSLILILIMLCSAAYAENIPQIGEHHPVLIFEKNENPQNIMVAYVKTNESCQLQMDPKAPGTPLFDFYWLMNRERYKPVHRMIKAGIRNRLEFLPAKKGAREFELKLNDLKELKQDLHQPVVEVTAKPAKGGCEVHGTLQLGPSDGNKKIQLQKIYSVSRKTLAPPFRKVKSITLTGMALDSSRKIERTYVSR